MNFTDINVEAQAKVLELLNEHIATSVDIIKADHILLPMLIIFDSRQLFSLQPKNDETDVDKAYAFVVDKLKKESFSYALFSYSTQIELENSKISNAIKTYIFTAQGIEISFYTPYSLKGLLRKSINVEKTIFGGIKEHVFD